MSLCGKRFHSNEDVEKKTNAYFAGLNANHPQMLEDRYNKCIALDGDYVQEQNTVLFKKSFFIVRPKDFQPMFNRSKINITEYKK